MVMAALLGSSVLGAVAKRGKKQLFGGKRPRGRRRRTRLTPRAKDELLWIRNHIGRTAASEYLGSYMRGR